LDAETGDVVWTRRSVGRLRGASDDGKATLVSIESLTRTRSLVLAIDRSGKVLRQLYVEASIGTPLVADAYAFLPYNRKMVLVFDLLAGREVARIPSSSPVSHAFRLGRDIYFGEQTAVRFDDHIVEARNGGGTRLELPPRSFPRQPVWRSPGSIPLPIHATQGDVIGYRLRPVEGPKGPAIDDYLLTYYELVLGLEAPDGDLAWIHRSRSAVLAAEVGSDSVLLCDAAGGLTWLDRSTGRVIERSAFEEAVIACVVQPGPPDERIASGPPRPLAAQLAVALADPRPELTQLQLELVDELRSLGGEAATEALVDLARRDTRTHPEVRARAAELLAERRDSLAPILVRLAVDQHRPWLSPTSLPLIAMAHAIANNRLVAAAPLLAARLLDPTLLPAQAAAVAEALEEVGGPSEHHALVAFLAGHACPPPGEEAASLAVARTLARLGATAPLAAALRGSCDNDAMKASLRALAAGGSAHGAGRTGAGPP
ncbi:MAG: hypothetical protein KC731_12940, partial [Myxococcales bacterium]|nr:hypothetical protein [Myxococcales bacterium]